MRLTLTSAIVGVVFALPAIAAAAITTLTHQRLDITVDEAIFDLYDYGEAVTVAWQSGDRFELGQGQDVEVIVDEAGQAGLTLAPRGTEAIGAVSGPDPGVPWWDTGFGIRNCLTVDHTAPGAVSVDGFTVPFALDLDALTTAGHLQADRGDLRAVAEGTELPLWVDEHADRVWVRTPELTAGTSATVCLYFDALALDDAGTPQPLTSPSNHTVEATFSSTSLVPRYVSVGAAPDGLTVAAHFDSTEVAVNGETVTLGAGELWTFGPSPAGTIVASTGPLSGQVIGGDSIAPLSWATTNAAIASTRGQQRLQFFAPFGDATVQVEQAGAAPDGGAAEIAVAANTTGAWVESADADGSGAITVTSDRPVVIVHERIDDGGTDRFVVAPPADVWFGSGPAVAVATGTTTVHVDRARSADSSEADLALTPLVPTVSSTGTLTGEGLRFAVDRTLSDAEVSAPDAALTVLTQGATDSATFTPVGDLSNRYVVPISSDALLLACPEPNVTVTITAADGSVDSMLCDNPVAGFVGDVTDPTPRPVVPPTVDDPDDPDDAALTGRGVVVASSDGTTFALTVEASSDGQTNASSVLGPTLARRATWPMPVLSQRFEGLYPTTGTWTGPMVDTTSGPDDSNVFGLLTLDAEGDPEIVAVSAQLATGTGSVGSPLGPDGSDASAYSPGTSPVHPTHYGDQTAQVTVTLTTEDPTIAPVVTGVTLTHDLGIVARTPGAQLALAPRTLDPLEPTRQFLVRSVPRPTMPDASTATVTGEGESFTAVGFGPSADPGPADVTVEQSLVVVLAPGVTDATGTVTMVIDLGATGARIPIELLVTAGGP